jgi:putative flippase GtrA
MRTLNELKQIFRFVLAAGLATGVHLIIAEALVLSRLMPSALGANAVAFVPAVAVSYFAQRRFTFRSQGSTPRFLALALAGFALNNLVLLDVTGQGFPCPLGLLVSGLASPVLSYIGCRQLVFAQKKRPAEKASL